MYDNLISKDLFSFWKTWRRQGCRNRLDTQCVDGKTNDGDIATIFKSKFCCQVINDVSSDLCYHPDSSVFCN
jgi:hypothetical protein